MGQKWDKNGTNMGQKWDNSPTLVLSFSNCLQDGWLAFFTDKGQCRQAENYNLQATDKITVGLKSY
jgi:hypothetical protein